VDSWERWEPEDCNFRSSWEEGRRKDRNTKGPSFKKETLHFYYYYMLRKKDEGEDGRKRVME